MANVVVPVRSVVKGSGAWVDEVFTDPSTQAVVKVTSFTLPVLQAIKENMDAKYAADSANVASMIAMLS